MLEIIGYTLLVATIMMALGVGLIWLMDRDLTTTDYKPTPPTMTQQIRRAEDADDRVTSELQSLGVDLDYVTRYGKWEEVRL